MSEPTNQEASLDLNASGISTASVTQQSALEELFMRAPSEALKLTVQKLEALETNPAATVGDAALMREGLQAAWNFFEGIRLMEGEASFEEARLLFENSARDFHRLKLSLLCDMATGFQIYTGAVLETQNGNLGRALEYFSGARDYLKKAGKFKNYFQSLIDHLEVDACFTAACRTFQNMDFDNSEIWIARASAAAQKVAKTYYPWGSLEAERFLGQAFYHRAFFAFNRMIEDGAQFNFDLIAGEKDPAAAAREAARLLKRTAETNANIAGMYAISQAFVELFEVMQALANFMRTVLRASFKAAPETLLSLKQRVRQARNLIAEAGPQAVTFVRFCDRLTRQIDNLEKLCSPSKKDFGIYSGLISSAIFFPVFLVSSWANAEFKMGIPGGNIFLTSIFFSLIGGFGFGALKFKGVLFSKFFPGKRQSEETSES